MVILPERKACRTRKQSQPYAKSAHFPSQAHFLSISITTRMDFSWEEMIDIIYNLEDCSRIYLLESQILLS